jgi:hypothetical protein
LLSGATVDSTKESTSTAVGVAYSPYAERLIGEAPGLVDFVEIAFEQLAVTPQIVELERHAPIVLHCASLSLAGNVPPAAETADELAHWIAVTKTPWLGEHLAYVRADGVLREHAEHPAFAAGSAPAPFNVGYTVSPQLSEAVLDRVAGAVGAWTRRFGLPVLVENGPIYFTMPGSTMSQFAFLRELCARSGDVLLLLDLAHLWATCRNVGADPFEALDGLPLERVIEVHVSGAREQSGVAWDDHVEPAPPVVFELLERLLARAAPRAVTIEYNWDAGFPLEIVARDVGRVRSLIAASADRSEATWKQTALTPS